MVMGCKRGETAVSDVTGDFSMTFDLSTGDAEANQDEVWEQSTATRKQREKDTARRRCVLAADGGGLWTVQQILDHSQLSSRNSESRKMIKAALSVLLVLVALSSTFGKYIPKSGKRIPQTLSRGWGDQLIWAQTYEEALYWSRSRNKPLMVLFHLEDCPHSKALKKVFSEDDKIQKMLDEDFIVLNLVVNPAMTVRADINGRYSNRMYAYEPSDLDLLKGNMEAAKKLLKSEL
ncbi:hypothetical protein FQN60_007643 [Etheostoma spectabile]|uniref:Anterior gradient protein 2 homolog n=1 Tax=Etheostoma spectabile TaxID=54343 RepID=A0A5J5CY41_9PERO|nr:hypothetical protein FQN60_007643 [Etheostoma spectabile]